MKTPKINSIGKHWHLELYGCDVKKIEKTEFVQASLREAAHQSGATIVNENFHQFSPFGVSGVVVIEESHFTIHTWPEYGYAAVDFFTCGEGININKAVEVLKGKFETEEIEITYFDRGDLQKAKSKMKTPLSK